MTVKSEEPRPEVRPGFQRRRQRVLNGYIPGDPGSGRSVARPVGSIIALLDLCPHAANTDHDRPLPLTHSVAGLASARCVLRWITEDRLRSGVHAQQPATLDPVYGSLLDCQQSYFRRESNPGCRLERPRSWPLNDRNIRGARGRSWTCRLQVEGLASWPLDDASRWLGEADSNRYHRINSPGSDRWTISQC